MTMTVKNVMCNDCQMIVSHDLDFLVLHKTCICSLINMQVVYCLIGYDAWVVRLTCFAIHLPIPQSFSTYDVLSKNMRTNRIGSYLLAFHANEYNVKSKYPLNVPSLFQTVQQLEVTLRVSCSC